MKTLTLILIALMAILVVAAPQAMAEPPFSTMLVLNATNGTADFQLAGAVQPTALRLWNALPLAAAGQTCVVERLSYYVTSPGTTNAVTNWFTNTIASLALASNVATASSNLTDATWVLPNNIVRLRGGPTNAFLEFQGTR